MTNDTGSELQPQEGQPKERVIKLGEWFNPFTDYENIPYLVKSEGERLKRVSFLCPSVGRSAIDAQWLRIVGKRNMSGNVILPFGEKRIDLTDQQKNEEKFESRLMGIGFLCEDERYIGVLNLPFEAELELQDGRAFYNRFYTVDNHAMPYAMTSTWRERSGVSDDETELLFPEVENILSQIKVRIIASPK